MCQESGHTSGKCSERKERRRSSISGGSWYADVRPMVLREVASVFPWCSVSSSSDMSEDVSVVSSSIFVSSFSCLYFSSDTTCIVFYYLAASLIFNTGVEGDQVSFFFNDFPSIRD